MTESQERARSFGAAAAAYAQHRPGYPATAIEWALEPAAGRELLDLAAGTGKLTESLLALPGAHVSAVEPDPAMLDELRVLHPAADARDGTAESIPLADASVDAVLVGQAFHWFDPARALPEIARVLRPGGVLAVLWNSDDHDVDWVAGYHEAAGLSAARQTSPERTDSALPADPGFGPSTHRRFPNPVPTSVDGLVATLATHSWALIHTAAERDAAFGRMRAYLATRPETSAGEFVLPVVTDVLRALRR